MAPESVVNPSRKVDNPTACVALAAIENLPSKVCLRLSEQRQLRLEKNTYCLSPKNARTPPIACLDLGAIVQPGSLRRTRSRVSCAEKDSFVRGAPPINDSSEGQI